MTSTYLFEEFICRVNKDSIHTIVECGSRDCLDAIAMKGYYKPNIIYSFECNPESIPVCKKNIKGIKDIILVPLAVSNADGELDFYATDMEHSTDKNIGASSLLQHWEDNTNGYVQKKITVKATRLDTFMDKVGIKSIDLLCMDLQGAEPLALDGLGKRIQDVKYVISEVSKIHQYHGDMLLRDFNGLMRIKGFQLAKIKMGNALYVRN